MTAPIDKLQISLTLLKGVKEVTVNVLYQGAELEVSEAALCSALQRVVSLMLDRGVKALKDDY
jgi:hypothetical protein